VAFLLADAGATELKPRVLRGITEKHMKLKIILGQDLSAYTHLGEA